MRRVWGALVALSAVFLLHGVQCAGHDFSPWADDGATTALTPAASSGHHVPSPAGAHTFPVASYPLEPGSAGTQPPHPSSGDLWATCLAVLAAGLALLVAPLLRPRPGPGPSGFRARVQRSTRGRALLRPPDLFILCVLRN